MLNDQLSILCENYYSGSPPPEFLGCFEKNPVYENLALKYQKKVVVNKKLQFLNTILEKISDADFTGKEEFSEYLRHKYRRNCKPGTIKSAFSAVSGFLSFYKREEISDITRHDIEAFVEHEQDRGLKPATVRTTTCCLYAFIKYLVENDIVSHELMQRKVNIKLPQLLPRAIDPEDINLMLSVIDKTRDRAMLLLLLRTGMRIGELLNARVDDLDFENNRVAIYEAEKTGTGRVVYFSDDAKEALLKWINERLPEKSFLFYSQGHVRMSYETARRIFKRYLEKAGLQHKDYTLHCLRHTYATDLLNAGMRLECLQTLMGHTSLEVTRRYAKLSDKSREEEYFRAMAVIENGDYNGLYEFDN